MSERNELRIGFLGTPEFAVSCLAAMVDAGKNVACVITAPDKKAGRGRQMQESAVKKYALEKNIPLLQPSNLKDPAFLEELKSYQLDLQVVVAFRMLPEKVWNMPPLGTFNLHASILPKFRGAAPINWAIIQGEKESGVSTFFLKHEIDTGDLLFQESVEIEPDETAGTLHDKLMVRGAELVVKTINAIEADEYKAQPQKELPEHEAHLLKAPKIFRSDCKIDWSLAVEQIDRFVRGLSPYPTAWTEIKSKTDSRTLNLKLYQVKIVDQNSNAKTFLAVEDKALYVYCSKGKIELHELQLEGKKRMLARDLINGFNFEDYEID